MIGCLRTHVRKQPIIALHFESEIVLKFYNLRARSLSEWKEGWSVVTPPLLSPSLAPMLDFKEEDRAAMKIHELSITQKVHALVYEEGDSNVTWIKVELSGKLLSMQRERESLFCHLMRLQPFHGEVPKQFKELDISSLQLIGNRICKVLGVEERFMVNAARNIMSKFGQPMSDIVIVYWCHLISVSCFVL